MKKRVISTLLVGAMIFSLAGCGTKQEAEPEAPAPAETTEKADGDAAAEETADIAWPEKTINIICPFSAGGDTDFNARIYAEKLTEILGVNCIVTNVTGNGGATGAQQVFDSEPDGNTVLFYHDALYVNNVTGATEFGMDGFELACVAGKNAGNVVCVSTKSEYETLEDLVEASKNGNVTFASNVGATTHVMGAMMNAAGANFNLVDMGNASDRIAALMGGQCDAIPNPLGTTQQYLDSGDFRALCLLEDERNEHYPDIPTAKELGYDASFPIYYFFAFPDGTDQAIVDKFADACEQVSNMKEIQQAQFESFSQSPFFAKGEEAIALEKEQQASVEALRDMLNQ